MSIEPSESPISALLLSSKGKQEFTEWSNTSKVHITPSSAKRLRDDIRETLEFADFPDSPFCISFLRSLLAIADDSTLCEVCNVALYSAEKGVAISSLLPIDKSEVSLLSEQNDDVDDNDNIVFSDDDDKEEEEEKEETTDIKETNDIPNGYCMLNDNDDDDEEGEENDDNNACEFETNFENDECNITPPEIKQMGSNETPIINGDDNVNKEVLPQDAIMKLRDENNKVIDSIELLIKNFELELLLAIDTDEEALLDNGMITGMFCAINDEVEKVESDPKTKENVYASANKVFSRFAGKMLADVRDEITSDLRDVLYDELVMVRAAKAAAAGTVQVPHIDRAGASSSHTAATRGSESSASFIDDE